MLPETEQTAIDQVFFFSAERVIVPRKSIVSSQGKTRGAFEFERNAINVLSLELTVVVAVVVLGF